MRMISVNGQSQVPPGFRFHPTEEELLQYYLKKKVASEKIDLDVIQDVDLNQLEPWDIQEKCRIGWSEENDWYFFSHKDKKYPTGTRTNRATYSGFWKATGRDKVIYGNSRRIGMRKTLVFYKGRAPHGQKSDWIMHEYRLNDATVCNGNGNGDGGQEEGWVVCRVFKKKLLTHKISHSPLNSTTNCNWSPPSSSSIEQMLHSIDFRSFSKLPALLFPDDILPFISNSHATAVWAQNDVARQLSSHENVDSGMSLQEERYISSANSSFSSRRYGGHHYRSEGDLWSFAPTSNDQLCDVHPI